MSPCLQGNGKCIFLTALKTEVEWIITEAFVLIPRKLITYVSMVSFFQLHGNTKKKMHLLQGSQATENVGLRFY